MMSSEPKYTIEQIELLRRLVRTGLSKEEIIHAVDTMTRLDRELGPITPPSYQLLHTNSENRASPAASPAHPQQSPQSSLRCDIGNISDNSDVDTTTFQLPPSGPSNIAVITRSQESIPKDIMVNHSFYPATLEEVDRDEIQSLMNKGDAVLRDEIREFLKRHNISQNQLGREIGVTGSYVSQYFHNLRCMRTSNIALMCKWYILKKRELEGSASALVISAAQSSYSLPSPIQSRASFRFSPYPSRGEAAAAETFRKKERFVWKENCTKVLETYFKKNLYPNDSERVRLAEACNAVQQIVEVLPENSQQIVTPERVYHWFANRRKELNKRKKHSDLRLQESDNDDITLADFIDTTVEAEGPSLVSINRDHEGHPDNDQPGDPKEIANQLQEVNNSILTFMKAVEEKTDQEAVKNLVAKVEGEGT